MRTVVRLPTRSGAAARFPQAGKTLVVVPSPPAKPPGRDPRPERKLWVVDARAAQCSSPKGAPALRFGIWRSRFFGTARPHLKWRYREAPSLQPGYRLGGLDFWVTIAALAIAVLMIVAATQAQGQTLTVLHSFTTKGGGSQPYAGVTIDRAGNLYGATTSGANGNAALILGVGCGKSRHDKSRPAESYIVGYRSYPWLWSTSALR